MRGGRDYKLMRLLQYLLNEEYETRIKMFGRSFEVFTNPTQKELKSLQSNDLKFIADSKDKKVYVWDVIGPLHGPAWRQINGGHDTFDRDVLTGRIIPGYFSIDNGKPVMDGSDGDHYYSEYLSTITNMPAYRSKWEWVNRYIDINTYIS